MSAILSSCLSVSKCGHSDSLATHAFLHGTLQALRLVEHLQEL